MSKKGALLFALNNAEIDYIKLATLAAKRIQTYLNVPVSVVTDLPSSLTIDDDVFDKVIVVESEQYSTKNFRDGATSETPTTWKNSHRNSSFTLSPYDETLVMDVDYVINSSVLAHCWNQPHDFLIYRGSADLAHWRDAREFTYVNDYSIPFYWATVFWFRKTETTEHFFNLLDYIKENWQYYSFLYHLPGSMFRNDYAFSIAIHIMNGFTDGDFVKKLPGKMYYTLDLDYLIKQTTDSMYFLVQNETTNTYIPLKVSGMDVHVMNKYSLLRMNDE